MEPGYLADTNVVIDYLENNLPEYANNLVDNTKFQISVITRIELLAWPKATEEQLTILKSFIDISKVFVLDESVVLKSIEIRKKYKLKLPDAIIAATALVNNLTLLTRNLTDFKKIIEIRSIDLHAI